MSVLDLLPGGKGPDSQSSIEAEAAKLATEMGDAANPVDPYAGTELSRENMGREPVESVPTAPEQPTAEPASEPAASGEDATDASGVTIPKGRLDAEIAKRRAVEEREREQARLYHELQGRMNAIQDALRAAQQQQQAPQEPDTPPDAEVDPIGALRYTQKKLDEQNQYLMQQRQAEQMRAAEAQMWAIANRGANEFRAKEPTYDNAVKYMVEQRQAELRALGVPDQYLPQAIEHETKQLVAAALQSGRNPAEVAFLTAKARGFGMAQTAQPAAGVTAAPMAATPAAVQLAQPSAPAKAAAAVNLPSSGLPQKGKLSIEQIVTTGSDEEFDKLWQEMERDSHGRKRKPLWDRTSKRA